MVSSSNQIKIKFISNWDNDYNTYEYFNMYTEHGNYTHKNLVFTLNDDDADFFILCNGSNRKFPKDKTIYYLFEPMDIYYCPGYECIVSSNDPDKYIRYFGDKTDGYQPIFWKINKTYNQILNINNIKKTKILSGIISGQATTEMHRKRLYFTKTYLNRIDLFEHFGSLESTFDGDRCFRGKLRHKDEGLYPYKYSMALENCRHRNLFSDKIIDCIMCETLAFFDGCENLEDILDPLTFIRINIDKPYEALHTIVNSIRQNEYENRIEAIKKEKNNILKYKQIMQHICNTINDITKA